MKQPNKETLLPTLFGSYPMSKVDAAVFNGIIYIYIYMKLETGPRTSQKLQ